MIKQRARIFTLFLITVWHCSPIFADTWQRQSSRSFMLFHPLNRQIQATSFLYDQAVADKKPYRGLVRVLGLYQQSRCSPEAAAYFLTDCQSTILFAGDNTPYRYTRNVRAEYLGLPANFSGTLTLRPEHKQGGVLFTYNHDIKNIVSFDWLSNVWFTFSIPFIWMKNSLNPCQANIQNPGLGTDTEPRDILQAINPPRYLFGRIAPCSFSKFGPSEINIGLGTSWMAKNNFLLWYQTTLDIPTFSRTKADYLFKPVIGPNGHLSWTNEIAIGLPLQPDDACYVAQLMFNAAAYYYFGHSQERVMDLHNKPWGRYLMLRNKINTDLVVPAINLTSQCVRVHPRSFITLAASFRFTWNSWIAQLGYDLWAHRREEVQFLTQYCSTRKPAISDFGIASSVAGKTASKSTISFLADADPDGFVTLHQNDINRNSGAGQATINNAFHIEIGKRCDWGYCALGGFLEQPNQNAALELWGVWGTVGISF